ncbi:MAG: chemotaxis protein CheW [Variovorax sp.]
MARQREALRDFQARLSERLRQAQTTGLNASWLAVKAADANYLIPLAHAGEIFPYTAPQPVPYTQPWFLGVANLRGGVFGVIDLSGFVAPGMASEGGDKSISAARLLALNEALEVNCALQIDRLIGLRSVDAFAKSKAPDVDAPAWFGHAYTDAEGGHWQELNLQALSQQAQFLAIGD